jgi:hypothetical protein
MNLRAPNLLLASVFAVAALAADKDAGKAITVKGLFWIQHASITFRRSVEFEVIDLFNTSAQGRSSNHLDTMAAVIPTGK